MMSCKIFKQSCKVQVQRFYQRDKTKSWSGLKLSSADGDWVVDLEHWLEYQGYNCEIFKQSCKVQRFNQRDKTKSWSFLKLSSADGDGDVDLEQWLEYDQGYYCEIFKQSCKVQRFNQRDKTKSWSGLKLSCLSSENGDGDVHHELRLECCRCYC